VLISDQRLIQRWWVDYAGDEEPTNTLLREFYVSVVRPSDLYYYGIVYEVFDLLTNDLYEWRGRHSQPQEVLEERIEERIEERMEEQQEPHQQQDQQEEQVEQVEVDRAQSQAATNAAHHEAAA
jgi:hypothetical protein